MDEITPLTEYYDVIPEFNSAGRLCNYHTGGAGDTVRVMADEWERFNQLAGRQHEITHGVVTYNADLAPCMPDAPEDMPTDEERIDAIEAYIVTHEYETLMKQLEE